MHYIKLSDLRRQLDVDETLLEMLATEELIQIKHTLEGEAVLSDADVDRVRLTLLLTREMEVNLPGVEVILHLRDELLSMHRQFDEVLRELVDELRKRLADD